MIMLLHKWKSLVRWTVRTFYEHVGPIRVLFYVSNEIGFANQKPLLEVLATDRRFHVGVCVERGEEIVFSDHQLSSLFVRHQLPERRARRHVWHYVVTTNVIRTWFAWDFVGIHLGHGSCVANGHQSDETWATKSIADRRIGIAFLPGLGHYGVLSETRPDVLENPAKAMFICGVSKLAELAAKGQAKDAYVRRLGLLPARRTVLVSSHWTRMSFLRDFGLTGVRRLCEHPEELNVIVTAHPKLWVLKDSDGFDGPALLQALMTLELEFGNLRVVPTGAPFDLMAGSDFIVCDHSSIRVEYTQLGRPAALYRNKLFVCQSALTDRLYREASEVFCDIEELDRAISRILTLGYDKSAESESLRRHFVADTSGTAGTIHDILLRCGPVSSVRSKRWPRLKQLEREHLALFFGENWVPVQWSDFCRTSTMNRMVPPAVERRLSSGLANGSELSQGYCSGTYRISMGTDDSHHDGE